MVPPSNSAPLPYSWDEGGNLLSVFWCVDSPAMGFGAGGIRAQTVVFQTWRSACDWGSDPLKRSWTHAPICELLSSQG